MEDFFYLQQRLAVEDASNPKVDRILLEEAAEIGRILVEKNEELQRENQALRSQRRSSVASAISESCEDLGSPDFAAPARSSSSLQAAALSGRRSHRPSASTVLAEEYDLDMDTVLQENRQLRDNSLKLERDNRELQAKLQELCNEHAELDDVGEGGNETRQTRRRWSGSNGASSSSADHADLMSELDTEQAQNWELREQLSAAKRESAEFRGRIETLVAEIRDHQQESEAREDELVSLHGRFLEVTDLLQQQWLAGSVGDGLPDTSLLSPSGRAVGRRGERHDSLAQDLQTAFVSSADDSVCLQHGADVSCGAAGRPQEQRLAEKVEEMGGEIAELRRKLAVSESAEQEAREAAARHRELARRAKASASKDAQELRKRLSIAEGGHFGKETGLDSCSIQSVLESNESLRRSLKAERKARMFVEAELLRTLTGIRRSDLEMC